jgi:deoxyribodipyrimidine photolyase
LNSNATVTELAAHTKHFKKYFKPFVRVWVQKNEVSIEAAARDARATAAARATARRARSGDWRVARAHAPLGDAQKKPEKTGAKRASRFCRAHRAIFDRRRARSATNDPTRLLQRPRERFCHFIFFLIS